MQASSKGRESMGQPRSRFRRALPVMVLAAVAAFAAIRFWPGASGPHQPSDCVTEYLVDTRDVRISCP